jgi:hypothetical protein
MPAPTTVAGIDQASFASIGSSSIEYLAKVGLGHVVPFIDTPPAGEI